MYSKGSPTVGFDTRGINQLEDGGARSESVMQALKCGFKVLLPAMAVDEILSTPKNPRREALLARCQRLLASGECFWPPHEILRLLIAEHFRNPSLFDWPRVGMRARVYEYAIIERDFTAELCVQQRKEQFELEKRYEKTWRNLRPKLDEILARDPAKRPTSYSEALSIAVSDGGLLWGTGRELYRYVTGSMLTEVDVKQFIAVCPPFRAACYAIAMNWYVGALKMRLPDENSPAGRNDLLMAVYLPYCARFIADESAQVTSLREIAAEASIDCDVLSLAQFDDVLTLAG